MFFCNVDCLFLQPLNCLIDAGGEFFIRRVVHPSIGHYNVWWTRCTVTPLQGTVDTQRDPCASIANWSIVSPKNIVLSPIPTVSSDNVHVLLSGERISPKQNRLVSKQGTEVVVRPFRKQAAVIHPPIIRIPSFCCGVVT